MVDLRHTLPVRACIRAPIGSAKLYIYQLVGIGNVKWLHWGYYTKKHRGGCTRGLLRPGPPITNRARSVRLVIGG